MDSRLTKTTIYGSVRIITMQQSNYIVKRFTDNKLYYIPVEKQGKSVLKHIIDIVSIVLCSILLYFTLLVFML